MWTSIKWSHKLFPLALTLWVCVLFGSASASSPSGNPRSQNNPQTASGQPWWQGPLQVADGLATVVIAIATIVYALYAARQWSAIREQSNIAKDALIADKRAIIYATGLNEFWEQDPATSLYNWRFSAGLRNGGKTATRNMRMYVNCEIRNSVFPLGYAFTPHDSTSTDPSIVRGMIPPETALAGGTVPRGPAVTPQDIQDSQQNKKFIYIWGWVEYSDVFPNTPRHVTRYCWLIVTLGDPTKYVPNTPGQPPTPGTLLFRTIHHSEGNSMDEG